MARSVDKSRDFAGKGKKTKKIKLPFNKGADTEFQDSVKSAQKGKGTKSPGNAGESTKP